MNNIFEIGSDEAYQLYRELPAVHNEYRNKITHFLDGIIDINFQIFRGFYPSHRDFIRLLKGKCHIDGEQIHVYITRFEVPDHINYDVYSEDSNSNGLDLIIRSSIITKIIEISYKERELFGGYRFIPKKGEALLKFAIELFNPFTYDTMRITDPNELEEIYKEQSIY